MLFKSLILGLSLSLSCTFQCISAGKLPAGVISIPLVRIQNQTFYGAKVAVGTPMQSTTVKIDTGSSTFNFVSSSNPICKTEGANCSEFGTYNNLTSSTAVYIGGFSDGLEDSSEGAFLNDTVNVGGRELKKTMLGTDDIFLRPDDVGFPVAGLLGLANECLNHKCNSFPTLLQQLADKGILKKRAFSVYLGQNQASSEGTLLLGGIDRAKLGGRSFTLPVSIENELPINVPYDSLGLVRVGHPARSFSAPQNSLAQWDTGDWTWGLPEELWKITAPRLGLSAHSVNRGGAYRVDCSFRSIANESLVVGFGQGKNISIPLGRLVDQDGENCFTWIRSSGSFLAEPGFTNAFGSPFLRSVYFTFDYDNLTVTMSQVKYTKNEDIVAL